MATIMAEIQVGHLLNISDITSINMLSNNTYKRLYLFAYSSQFVVVKTCHI
jgi:hypothetical protein